MNSVSVPKFFIYLDFLLFIYANNDLMVPCLTYIVEFVEVEDLL